MTTKSGKLNLKRGDVVLAAAPGDYGKPRPAVVVQSDYFLGVYKSVVVCPITSKLHEIPLARVLVHNMNGTGLKKESQIMVDKIMVLKGERIKRVIGRLDDETMIQVNRALALFLGLIS